MHDEKQIETMREAVKSFFADQGAEQERMAITLFQAAGRSRAIVEHAYYLPSGAIVSLYEAMEKARHLAAEELARQALANAGRRPNSIEP